MTETATKQDVYLIHHDGIGALVKIDTGATSSDRFGEMQRDFAISAGAKPADRDYADMICLDPQQSADGVLYDWELAGPNGASYLLIRWPTTTDDAIERAKAYVRRRFDVVRLRVLNIRRLIDFAV